MRESFQHANFEALAGLWNQFYPERYWTDAELLKLNTVQSPVFDWGVSQIEVVDGEVVGFVAFKRSAAALYKGPSVDQAHLSAIAYKDPRIAVDLMAEAKHVLRNRGVNRIVFGSDSRHFWPGCPVDCGTLCGFLMVEGFEQGNEVHDLERDLRTYVPARPLPSGIDFRTLTTEDDVVACRVFLEGTFPGRWHFDSFEKLRVEDRHDCIFAAFDGTDVVGFALIQSWRDRFPIGGGVWRQSLGEKWGSLGPIGVTEELRGNGIGHGLLSAALSHLRDAGVERCIIDWTTLDDFYGVHGFEVSRIYRYSQLDLGD